MAKTQTNLTETEAHERFAVLSAKAREFILEIQDFQDAYDCDTVGLSEWIDDIDQVMYEIDADINSTFGEDE